MKVAIEWFDQRTGWIGWVRSALYENIPGGARWRYVWGSAVGMAIVIQFITGIVLWMGYSPSVQTAWDSVNYIQNGVTCGWLLRGLHHYTAQILPVLLALHLMQVVMDGAYKAPREVNFWVGLLLLQVVLFMALTGYQLPWDQKGFWATKVAMNILGIVPIIGKPMQTVLIGGPDYGQLTLTRFFGIHAGVLPAMLLVLVAVHICLARRAGYAGKRGTSRPDAPYWPDQALRNAVACLAVVATLLVLIFQHRIFSTPGPLGARLSAPADPSEPYSAARPEWYFLFLFQFLKFFPGGSEIIGAIIIPGIVMGLIFLMPFIARTKGGHRFNVGFLGCLFAGIGYLTYIALSSDASNPAYQEAVKSAERDAARVQELAASPIGVPAGGSIVLLREDPLTQGPKLFAKNCASCHRYHGTDGLGDIPRTAQSASDLYGFGSREWIAGLLDPERIVTTNYFGGTKFKNGKMPKFVKKQFANITPEQKAGLEKVVAALSAEAGLKSQAALDKKDAAAIVDGRLILRETFKCADCHQFHQPDQDATAPDLTDYASRGWLIKFLNNPAHPDFYGDDNDRMPAFGKKEILSDDSIGLIADWLRGDWYAPAPSETSMASKPAN